ncbi:MAG TPA: PEP/pyruvate-binding domain-containing protein [Polyangiaceae bacterium]|nr:PEP/pyruvate-binding domain-containing protein [Polyangiaceae bacterium]
MRKSWKLSALAALCLTFACGHPGKAHTALEQAGFVDFTTERIDSLAEFQQLAAVPASASERPEIAGAKFVITDFSDPARRRIRFLDGRYYQFHDEWYWFRQLNGQRVPGEQTLVPHPFATPELARVWARDHADDLPSELEMADQRLYAPEFYRLSLAESERVVAAGSLIHVPARPPARPEIWAFEVDYTDSFDEPALGVFFDTLKPVIPPEARGGLRWIARSPEQIELAHRLSERVPALRARTMTYEDVSVPGETEVYSPGIVAGRLESVRDLARISEAQPDSILLLGALPAFLPQARGLLTAIPQTPLAHLNLLARSRQIVNAYRGGVLEDPDVVDLLRSRAPVVVVAEEKALRFQRITEAQYSSYLKLIKPVPPAIQRVDASNAPYWVDLSRVEPSDLPALSALIGGKSSGMARLVRSLSSGREGSLAAGVSFDAPDRPVAVTIRAYRECIEPLLPLLRPLLADPNFKKFRKLRYLALEGAAAFRAHFPAKRDQELAKSYEDPRAVGPIVAVVRKGGVRHLVRSAPLPETFKAEFKAFLEQRFADYSPEQGLRFRSSSTVEDIEGFNGAGLYVSSTGFLNPRKASLGTKKRASVADALRRTWSSYFSAEAFEEREQNGIDHLSGDMAVLVHPRFDDALETANGVFTFTVAGEASELALDVQPGATSVTNPPTDHAVIPESSRTRRRGAQLVVERHSLSSLVKPGQIVLTDSELGSLYERAQAIATSELERLNQGLEPAQRRHTLVLDFEFRRVAAGWPALKNGMRPARFVLKQMRPLEPSPRVEAELRRAPVPRDLLSRATRIVRHECRSPELALHYREVFTNPALAPDLGYATVPFVSDLALTRSAGNPGKLEAFSHLDFDVLRQDGARLVLSFQAKSGYRALELSGDAKVSVALINGKRLASDVVCEAILEYAEPTELLRSYLASGTKRRPGQ